MTSIWHKLNRFLNKKEAIIVLLLVALIFRLPSLFEPFWYGDENIYLAIGQGIRKGLTLYAGISDFPNKPPMIYLLAALAKNVMNFRLLLLIFNLANVTVFYLLVSLFTTKNFPRFITTLVFIFLTSTPLIEGNIANAEIFFILPTTTAVWLLFRSQKSQKTKPHVSHFLAGLLLGFAFLFKIHVALDIAAIGLFFYVFSNLKTISPKSLIKVVNQPKLWHFLLGLSLPLIITLAFWTSQGVSPQALFTNAAGSTSYVSIWNTKNFLELTLGFGSLQARLLLLIVLTLALFTLRKKLDHKLLFVSLWLTYALFAALLSGRPYPHYLIQLIPPLLLGLLLFAPITKKSTKLTLSHQVYLVILFFVASSVLRFKFGFYPVVSYYSNFLSYATGQITRTDYYRRFDSRMPRNYALAKYLRQVTSPDERIYIWGTEPGVYALADRLPIGKLVTSFHVEDLNYHQPTLDLLQQQQTNIIVIMESETRSFSGLESLLASDYLLIKTIGDPTKSDKENIGSRALVYRHMQS